MEAAWIKLLTVLFSLPTFGVESDPAAPSAAEVTRYAPAQSDFTFYADLQAFVPNNYQALTSLPSHPDVRNDKQASAAATDLIQQAEMVRGMIKMSQGLDPITDVKWVAAWVTLPDAGDPTVVAVVRGNFPPDLLGKIGAVTGAQAKKSGAGQILSMPDGQSVGMTADGTLVAGTTALVQARLVAGWKPAKAPAQLVKMLDGKPFLLLASSMSARATRRVGRELTGDDAALARDLVGGHVFTAVALAHDGVAWTWTDKTARGFARAALASEGVIELMRAGHLGTRGLVRIALAGIGSYAGQSPEAAAIDRHQADILRVVESFTGDGNFQVKLDKDAATRTVSVRAWDKELAKVIPGVGAAVIAGAFLMVATSSGGMVGVKSESKAPATQPMRKPSGKPATPAKPAKPASP